MIIIHLYPGTGVRFHTCAKNDLHKKFEGKPGEVLKINPFTWFFFQPEQPGSKGDPAVRLVFDTRFMESCSRKDEEIFNLGNELVAILHPICPPVTAALVVDLGNTRSFGLVVDDFGRTTSMKLYPLRIYNYSGWTTAFTTTGVFQSHVCLEQLEDAENADETIKRRQGKPLSGLRTGRAAFELQNRIDFKHNSGRVSQVSPKRFFWDDDPSSVKWLAWCDQKGCLMEPRGVLYDAWLRERNIEPKFMPPSTLIGAMVVELYEQAEMQLNEESGSNAERVQGPRRIRHIAITYPPAWSRAERETYQRVIQEHLDIFCDERGLARANVRVLCDEATGTLLAYISNEVEKYGGQLSDWLASIGSVDEDGHTKARFAVIDVGGGTSDLIMADVSVTRDRLGMNQLHINRFHQDGVLFAGDELLRRVVAKIVLPAVAKAICPDNEGERCAFFSQVISDPRPDEILKRLRGEWAQKCWFPLAVEFVKAWQNGKPVEISADICGELEKFCKSCKDLISQLKRENVIYKGLSAAQIKFYLESKLKPDETTIREICTQVFADAAIRFGFPVVLADCDCVILSGKTTEFKYVRAVLQHHIPYPNFKFISFEKYTLAPKWRSISGNTGSALLGDVKMTTVMGAAVELCAEKGHQVFGLTSKVTIDDAHLFSDQQQYWGIVPSTAAMPAFKNSNAIFTDSSGSQMTVVHLSGMSLLIARRRSKNEFMTAQIAYELRVKPSLQASARGLVRLQRHLLAYGAVELKLEGVEDGGELELFSGMRQPLKTQHLELRQMIAQNGDFWMVDGNIQEEIKWETQ